MLWLFKFLACADWITPTVGFVETFAHDPIPPHWKTHTFFIPFVVSVPREQADEAIYHLQRRGVPLEYPISIPPAGKPPTVKEQVGAISSVVKDALKHRTWTWIPCLVGEKGCKGEMTCSACNCCSKHCGCVVGD